MGCVFLYNPESGRGKIGKRADAIVRALGKIFGEVTAVRTSCAEETAACVSQWGERCEAVIFAGGDGTFNAALQGAAGRKVTLGYIPAGTANDAAGNLGIRRSVRGALKVIARRAAKSCDCLQINAKRYAFCIVAAGSLTRVTYETPQRSKRRWGWFAYAFEVCKRIRRAQPFYAEAACGENLVRGEFALALIMNGRKLARFSVNRRASLSDGVCEAALVRQRGRGFAARWGARFSVIRLVLFGMRKSGKRVVLLRGGRIAVRAEKGVVWNFDGERGSGGTVDVQAVRGAVKVFAPK